MCSYRPDPSLTYLDRIQSSKDVTPLSFLIFLQFIMFISKWIACLLLSMSLTCSVESRKRPTSTETEKFVPINGNNSHTAHLELSEEEAEIGLDRDDQIRIRSATSLEALLLGTIRIGGAEICSSPFALSVMLGTWRTANPTPEELKDTVELRKTCYNALLEENLVKASRTLLIDNPLTESTPKEMFNSSNHEDLIFTLIQPTQPPLPSSRMSRQGPLPATPPKKDSPADPKSLQNANEIIKDRTADCKPRDVLVEIPREPNITYMPSCAVVKRCGGCCKHDSFQCVPQEISRLKKKVVALNNKGVRIEVKSVEIEKHDKCKCECKTKATDCNSLQTYDKKNCRCVCKMTGSSSRACKKPQYWDEWSCKCRCPINISSDCSTGSFFSSEKCRCVTTNEIINEESAKRM